MPSPIRYQSISTTGRNIAKGNFKVARPLGTTNGDLLLMSHVVNRDLHVETLSGWNLIAVAVNARRYPYLQTRVLFKIANNEPPFYEFSKISYYYEHVVGIIRYSGVDTKNPIKKHARINNIDYRSPFVGPALGFDNDSQVVVTVVGASLNTWDSKYPFILTGDGLPWIGRVGLFPRSESSLSTLMLEAMGRPSGEAAKILHHPVGHTSRKAHVGIVAVMLNPDMSKPLFPGDADIAAERAFTGWGVSPKLQMAVS